LSIEAKPERKKKKCVFEELPVRVATTPNTILQGVCFENLSASAKKTIAMVAMDLDNVHDVVSNISKFAATIFADLFNHKGKEENNGNTRMEHLDRVVAWALKEFKVGIVDLPTVEKDGVQNLFLQNVRKL
jgi:hypothetical protein